MTNSENASLVQNSSADRFLPSMDLHGLEKNPAAVYLARLQSANSRKAMSELLNRLVVNYFTGKSWADCPWDKMRYEHVVFVRASMLQKGLAAATINMNLCALRGVAREAWKLGQIEDHTIKVIESVESIRGTKAEYVRSLDHGESRALVESCQGDQNAIGARDAAIISLGVTCGLRRSEISSLTFDDFDDKKATLVIHGKGNRERVAFLGVETLTYLNNWLRFRGTGGKPNLFVVVRYNRVLTDRPLTPNGIYDRLCMLARKNGLKHFAPHDLRRTFATRMLDMGADLDTVKDAMGHSSVATTQRYDMRKYDRVRSFQTRVTV